MHAAKLACLAVAASLTLPLASASADPFTQLWVFGDSTVDTGWYKVSPYSGNPNFDMYLPDSAVDGFGAQTSNPGKVSVQVLAKTLRLHAEPANQGGTNYATSGARNRFPNDAAHGEPDPTKGLFQNAIPTIHQIDRYLRRHRAAGHALYVISSGGNDVSFAISQFNAGVFTDADARAYIADAANELGKEIKTLQSQGAKRIIVTNQPQDFGPNQQTKDYRKLYNMTLGARLAAKHVKYALGDVNSVRITIKNNMSAFGLTHISNLCGDRACTDPFESTCSDPVVSPHIKSGWAMLCSPASPVSTPTSANLKQSLFADDQHWATGGQKILGSYFYCLAKSEWSNLFTGFRARPPVACRLFGL